MAPWGFCELGAVSAAQAANVVFVAHRVAILLTGSVALGATRNPVPGAVDTLGVQAVFRGQQADLRQVGGGTVKSVMIRPVPHVEAAVTLALGPLTRDLRDQDLGVFVHGLSPVGASLWWPVVAI